MAETSLPNNPKPRLDVIGGGISGLLAAEKAVDAGYDVHVHEASPTRLGGKIQSSTLGNKIVNEGAEFVDTDHTAIIDLCERLKKAGHDVNLIPANDQSVEKFQLNGGSALSGEKFYAASYAVQAKIVRDKSIIARNPNGPLAQQLDAMPLDEYLAKIGRECDAERNVGSKLWRGVKRLFGSDAVPKSEKIAAGIASIYGSEAGQDPSRVSALQFVNESSAKVGSLLASDCGMRIEGGTQSMIDGLQQELEKKGVHFDMDSKATSVTRAQDGTFHLTFAKPEQAAVDTSKVVLALPMHALGNLGGLESLGLSNDDVQLLRGGQYTNNAKFTIKTTSPAESASLFSSHGFQAWSSSADTVTFLAGGELTTKYQGKKLMDFCIKQYAKANHVPETLFDKTQVDFVGPNKEKPCYASAAPGQVIAMQRFAQKAQYLADDGVGIVGTYMPRQEPGTASIGFMECGAESVQRIDKMFNTTPNQSVVNDRSFVDMVQNKIPPQQQPAAPMQR